MKIILNNSNVVVNHLPDGTNFYSVVPRNLKNITETANADGSYTYNGYTYPAYIYINSPIIGSGEVGFIWCRVKAVNGTATLRIGNGYGDGDANGKTVQIPSNQEIVIATTFAGRADGTIQISFNQFLCDSVTIYECRFGKQQE